MRGRERRGGRGRTQPRRRRSRAAALYAAGTASRRAQVGRAPPALPPADQEPPGFMRELLLSGAPGERPRGGAGRAGRRRAPAPRHGGRRLPAPGRAPSGHRRPSILRQRGPRAVGLCSLVGSPLPQVSARFPSRPPPAFPGSPRRCRCPPRPGPSVGRGAPTRRGDGRGARPLPCPRGTQRGTLSSLKLPLTSRLAVEVGRWEWGAGGSPASRDFLRRGFSPPGRGFSGWLLRRDGTEQTCVSCRGQGPSPRPADGRRDTGLAPGWGREKP